MVLLEETPLRVEETPLRVEETPLRVEETPLRVEVPPLRALRVTPSSLVPLRGIFDFQPGAKNSEQEEHLHLMVPPLRVRT